MASHEYSPQVALELLLRKVEERDAELANLVQAAIDVGKDIFESEAPSDYKKRRKYRKTVRFSHKEALGVSIDTLKAYFIEQPSLINTVVEEFAVAELDVGANLRRESFDHPQVESRGGVRYEKRLEVEFQTETRISAADQKTLPLSPTDKELIDEQKANIRRLSELFAFDKQ